MQNIENLVVVQADKGSATAVMDKEDYTQKIHTVTNGAI